MSKINFEPSRDWIVLPIPTKTTTDAGIILTGKSADSLRSNILEVLAAGPDCKYSVGDIVYIHPASEGLIIEIDGVEYIMVNESMAVVGRVSKASK